VRDEALERVYDVLAPDRPQATDRATVAVTLARLGREAGERYPVTWQFAPDAQNQRAVNEIATIAEHDGVGFMWKHASPRAIAEWLRKNNAAQRAWRLPPALVRAGDVDEAREFVRTKLREAEAMTAADWAAFYRSYAARFEQLLPELAGA
jgi:hypothetical protein